MADDPKPFAFLRDTELLVQRIVLAQVLGPPLALRGRPLPRARVPGMPPAPPPPNRK